MSSMTQSTQSTALTILGERQAGKTHLMIMMAIEEAVLGGTVWYSGPSHAADHEYFRLCLERAQLYHPEDIQRASHANGKQRITFTSGGEIRFGVPLWDGPQFDLHCVDDAMTAERRPNAKRTVRSVLL